MTSDEELIARVREALADAWTEHKATCSFAPDFSKCNGSLQPDRIKPIVDTLARRLEELKEGLAGVVAERLHGHLCDGPACQKARSLLHPEPQAGTR